jgi:polyisoprenoid-binding protein YceI
MNQPFLASLSAVAAASAIVVSARAEPVNYVIDSSHTFPSFEADHFAGMSVWRGKVNHTEGTVMLDREAETGTVNATFDMATVDFGLDRMNQEAYDVILHVEEFPTATYTGTLTGFVGGAPTAVEGMLTMHGVTRPVNLEVTSFKCQPHFRTQVRRWPA